MNRSYTNYLLSTKYNFTRHVDFGEDDGCIARVLTTGLILDDGDGGIRELMPPFCILFRGNIARVEGEGDGAERAFVRDSFQRGDDRI